MELDPKRAEILSTRIIPNVDNYLSKSLKLLSDHRSLGLITTTIDDVGYTALDEATKKADVRVVYAKSMYGGSSNASTKLAGEFLGIISGPTPEDVRSGLNAARYFIENEGCFYSANDDDTICFYAQTISRTGSYLSEIAGIKEGESLAYLIAPPLEAVYSLDVALKAAEVKLVVFYGPPTKTNFAGGLLWGSQSACKAACEAFKNSVIDIAKLPIQI